MEIAMSFLVTHALEIGLVLFVMCFTVLTIWTFTRSRNEIGAWSGIPLGCGDESDGNVKSE
jgi:uncharacterized membrane protein